MLDIRFIKENVELIKTNLKKKAQQDKFKVVDEIIAGYETSLKLKQQSEELRRKRNELSLKVNELVKQKKDVKTVIKEVKDIPEKIKELEEKKEKIDSNLKQLAYNIPNILHSSVPLGKDATENKVLKKVGKIPKFKFPIKNHVELGESLNLFDFDASAKVSGNGFYYLKGELALLNQALIRFGIDFMLSKHYQYIETPLMLREKTLFASMNKEEIENSVYLVKGEDLGFIGTSEQSLLAMHSGKLLKDLPKKYFY